MRIFHLRIAAFAIALSSCSGSSGGGGDEVDNSTPTAVNPENEVRDGELENSVQQETRGSSHITLEEQALSTKPPNQSPQALSAELYISRSNLMEGEAATITVRLSRSMPEDVNVTLSLSEESSTDASLALSQVKVVAGDRETTTTLTIIDDQEQESTEVAVLKADWAISFPTEAIKSASFIIEDNDYTPAEGLLLHLSSNSFSHTLDGQKVLAWSDQSGQNHTIQAESSTAPSFLAASQEPAAVVFDGVSSIMTISNHQDINTSGPYSEKSVSVLFKTSDDLQSRQMIFEQGGSSRGINVYLDQGYVYSCAWNIPNDDSGVSTPWSVRCNKSIITINTYYHLVLTLSSHTGELNSYLNQIRIGVQEGIGKLFAHSGTIGLGGVSSNTYTHDGQTGINYFKGQIIDFSLYGASLTAAEVEALSEALFREYNLDEPTFTAKLSQYEVQEGSDDKIQLTLTANRPYSKSTIFSISNHGLADSSDVALPPTITLPAYERSVIVDIGIHDDQVDELVESVELSLTGDFEVLGHRLSFNILDDDGYNPAGDIVFWLRGDRTHEEQWSDVLGAHFAYAKSEEEKPRLSTITTKSLPAYLFDGDNDGMTIADHKDINTASSTTKKTIAIVFQTGLDVTTRQVLFEQGGGSRGLNLYLEGGQLKASGWNIPSDGGDGAWGPLTLSMSISASTRYHVALVYDGVSSRSLALYSEGQLIGSISGAGTLYSHGGDIGIGAMIDGSYFGSASGGKGHSFKGLIAELLYWNESLDLPAIKALEEYLHSRYY